jgi:hypothetical protein
MHIPPIQYATQMWIKLNNSIVFSSAEHLDITSTISYKCDF